MKVIFIYALFIISPFFASANIWDNLFLGQGISFKLPSNFSMTLSLDQPFGKVRFNVIGSEDLNFLSVTHDLELGSLLSMINTSNFMSYKIHSNSANMYLNFMLKDCLAIHDEMLHVEIFPRVQQFLSLLTLLVSVEREGEFYKLETKKLLNLVDTSAAKNLPLDKIPVDKLPTQKIPELVLYFDIKSVNLKKIQIYLSPEEKYTLEITDLKSYNPSLADLEIPKHWHCEKETMKTFKELDYQKLLEEMKKEGELKYPAGSLLFNLFLQNYVDQFLSIVDSLGLRDFIPKKI